MSIAAPTLETKRLILRAFRIDDFEPVFAMLGNPAVARHIGGPILDRAMAWDKFARAPGFWALLGYGMWIVEERASGRIAGNIGFGRFERGIGLADIPEAAWVLDEWAHGRGIAGEAMTVALAWADENLPDPAICCIVDPENAPSLGLARKLGFAETRRAIYKGDETVVLERRREQK